jgi:phenylpropionate dioxygenase-like ring-hydroxylating dioxygenase large terminal subunit
MCHVPALPAFSRPDPATLRAHLCRASEQYGLVWVRLAGRARRSLPAFAPNRDAPAQAQLRPLRRGHQRAAHRRELSGHGALRLCARRLAGHAQATAIDDYQVQPTATGLLATQCRAWQPQSKCIPPRPAQVEYTYEVTAPYAAVLTKVPDAAAWPSFGYRESIAMFICPRRPETSRVWFRWPWPTLLPDEKLRDFQHTIFMQDQPVLESQRPQASAAGPAAELHTAADKASSAYRRHLRQLGITFGVC